MYPQQQQSLNEPNASQQHPYTSSSFRYGFQYDQETLHHQQPQDLDQGQWNTANAYQEQPTIEQPPEQPKGRQPRFQNSVEAWSKHLLTPGWRPPAGTYGMPLNAAGKVDDAGMLQYVAQLYNAFIDISDVYDTDNHRSSLERFQPNGAYTRNLDDIEAVCHVVVGTASCVHTHGVTSLAHKRVAGKIPQPNHPNHQFTFAQRIWLLACLAKHYKYHADALMRMCLLEDYIVGIWNLLVGAGFQQRFMGWSAPERYAWELALNSLGMSKVRPGGDGMSGTADTQAKHGFKRPHAEAEIEIGSKRRSSVPPFGKTPDAEYLRTKLTGFEGALSANTGPGVSSAISGSPTDPKSALEAIIKQRSESIRNSLHMPSRLNWNHQPPASGRSFSTPEIFSVPHWGDHSHAPGPSTNARSPSHISVDGGHAISQDPMSPNVRGLAGDIEGQVRTPEERETAPFGQYEHGDGRDLHEC